MTQGTSHQLCEADGDDTRKHEVFSRDVAKCHREGPAQSVGKSAMTQGTSHQLCEADGDDTRKHEVFSRDVIYAHTGLYK